MHPFKHIPPADGFCVSAAIANLRNTSAPIKKQQRLKLGDLTISEAAAHFRFYTEPIIAGVPINATVFASLIKLVADKVKNDGFMCIAVQTYIGGGAHFLLLLVGGGYIFTIDTLDNAVSTYADYKAEKVFEEHIISPIALHFEYDLNTRQPKRYSKADIAHLFNIN